MTKRIFHWLGEPITACDCDCHTIGCNIRHIVACCDLCYKEYIIEERVVDVDLLNKALEDHYLWSKEAKLNRALQELNKV